MSYNEDLYEPDDCTNISSKIPSSCSNSEVLCRVQTVCVQHEVPISHKPGEGDVYKQTSAYYINNNKLFNGLN